MRESIAQKYVDIERQLGSKFMEAIQSSDVKRMRLYANTLQLFQRVRLTIDYEDGPHLTLVNDYYYDYYY